MSWAPCVKLAEFLRSWHLKELCHLGEPALDGGVSDAADRGAPPHGDLHSRGWAGWPARHLLPLRPASMRQLALGGMLSIARLLTPD
jgi:hypothetical protein